MKVINIIFMVLASFFVTVRVFSQETASIGFSYQAVALDRSLLQGPEDSPGGKVLADHELVLRFSILSESPGGQMVYQEVHDATTDLFGIFRCIIGQGQQVVDKDLATLNWRQTAYYLQVEIDIGEGFFLLGTEVLTIPPYVVDSDADPYNEIQDLVMENGILSITNNNEAAKIDLTPSMNGAFFTVDHLTSNVPGDLTRDSFVFGSSQLEDDANTEDDDIRFLFNKYNGAFRAGKGLDAWDDVGEYSVAMGDNNGATGYGAATFGAASHSKGDVAFAAGAGVNALGFSSVALGALTMAMGDFSLSAGLATEAIGDYSLAMGMSCQAHSYGEISLGGANTQYVPQGGATAWDTSDRLFVLGNGKNALDRSDALIVYKSGDGELNGSLTLDPGNNDTGYTFPETDGINGQVLTTNGNGQLNWTNSGGNSVFVTSGNITSNEIGNYSEDDFVFGSPSLDNISNLNDDYRFFFDKSKGAFRAGWTTFNSWDDQYRGLFSVAFGTHTTASGNYSFAAGHANVARGHGSVALGSISEALSYGETVLGLYGTTYQVTDDVNSIFTFYPNDRLFVIGNGNGIMGDPSLRSDALVMLKSGNTSLHGLLTIDADNVVGPGEPYTLPGQDGTPNQIMSTDGNGTVSWVDFDMNPANAIQDLRLTDDILTITNNPTASEIDLSPYLGGAFSTVNGTTSNENGEYANDDFVFGSPSLNDDDDNAHDSRMFFSKRKHAFRAGRVGGDHWDNSNVGYGSVAFGLNVTASGHNAMAVGSSEVTAAGANSFAFGRGSLTAQNAPFSFAFGMGSMATASFGFAAGSETIASAPASIAMGSGAVANAQGAVAFGLNSEAAGSGSFAAGSRVMASGEHSVAFGADTHAAGSYSNALGRFSLASGLHSTTIGHRLFARSLNETVFGAYNTDYTPVSENSYHPDDRLFVVGNGLEIGPFNVTIRSDALVILKDGKTTLNGTLTIDADNVGGDNGYTLPGQEASANGHVMMSGNDGTVSWVDPGTFASDVRLKKNIVPLDGSLEKVLALNGVHFQWNGIYNHDPQPVQTGFIAQEVQSVLPGLVTQEEETDYLRVNYVGMIPHLVEAVKALKRENDKLRKDLIALQEQVNK